MAITIMQIMPTIVLSGATAIAQVAEFVFMFVSWNRPDSKARRIDDIISMIVIVLIVVDIIVVPINIAIALYK